ncbi:phage portal protein, partial [Escherichia coli]|uniref:phage portal protein n=1 Tax=Escherichia coli TaxID=562 RepID=UPI00111B4604
MGAPPCGSDYTTTGASRVPAGEVLMAILDDVIGVFSPGWKAARLRSRAVIQAYEAVKTTRTHKARRENRTADQLSQYGAVSLREQARYLDNNHDLVIGVFDKLEERVVGKNGIIVEPHPVLRNGAIHRDHESVRSCHLSPGCVGFK